MREYIREGVCFFAALFATALAGAAFCAASFSSLVISSK
jgi:hypothetical protein